MKAPSATKTNFPPKISKTVNWHVRLFFEKQPPNMVRYHIFFDYKTAEILVTIFDFRFGKISLECPIHFLRFPWVRLPSREMCFTI